MANDIDKILERLANDETSIVPAKVVAFVLARMEEIELNAKEKEDGEIQFGLSSNDET